MIQAADLTDWEIETSHAGFDSFISAISDIVGPPPQQEKSGQIAETPESRLEQQLEVQPEIREISQPPPRESEPAKVKPSESKPDSTETTELNSLEPRRTRNALKFSALAGVFLLLIGGVWWYVSDSKKVKSRTQEQSSAESELDDKPKPQKVIANNIGMRFVLIPAGSFTMGPRLSPEEVDRRYGESLYYKDVGPPFLVEITKPFYLQTTELTQGQWERVMGNNPSSFKDCGEDCPVEMVSWDMTQQFIRKINQMEGTTKYRLPTEAEWEYACRA